MIRSIANKSKLLNKKRVNVQSDFVVKNRSRNYGNVVLSRSKNYVTLSYQREYRPVFSLNTIRSYNTSSLVLGNPWDNVSKEVLAMPALSPTMNDGTIVSWLKKEGESYTAGETLAEIETDKATVSFDATDDGVLAKILVPEGTKNVTVGSIIAITVTNPEDVSKVQSYTPSTTPKSKPSTPKATPKSEPSKTTETKTTEKPAPKRTGERIFATPYAKLLAKEKGYDLSDIEGTGPNARIVGADILEYVPSRRKAEPTKVFTSTQESVVPTYTDIDVTNIRRVTAERLTFSKQNIPHYYLTIECNINNLIKLREDLNSLSKNEYKLSFNDFVIKAASKALKAVPEANSEWRGEVIRRYHNVDINVAVNTDAGLFTPLIKDADKKGLAEISNQVKSLAQKAKDNTITLDDMQTGTFTISNLGMLGITEFSAVINPPQACILAVGSVNDKVSVIPVESKDESGEQHYDVSIDKVMKVTLSCDHRVVDGAIGARWLQSFKEYMENPIKLIL